MARPIDYSRKSEVLDHIITYLSTHGMNRLSFRKLAESLGVSTSVLTHQFGTKEELVLQALGRAREANLTYLESVKGETPQRPFADAFISIWLWWMEAPHRLAFSRFNTEVMLSEGIVDPTLRSDLTLFWLRYFSQWLNEDGFSLEQAETKASLALTVLSGVTIDLISTGAEDRLTRSIKSFAETLRVKQDRT